MSEKEYEELKKIFENHHNGEIDLNDITDVTGISGKNLYNVIISFISKNLDSYDLKSNLNYIYTALTSLSTIIANYSDINKKRIMPKLAKIYEKSARLIEEHKEELSNESIDVLNNICKKVSSISFKISDEKAGRHDFLLYLITEHKNLNIIEKIITDFNINVRDKNGNCLFANILSNYLKVLGESKINDNDILYYNNIMRLIINTNQDIISDKEKSTCLNMIYLFLNKLSTKDKNFNIKKEQCQTVIKLLKREFTNESLLSDIAHQYNVDLEFDESILNAVKEKATKVEYASLLGIKKQDEYIVSIDGKRAIEIDDALSCRKLENGNYLLGVHIADVLAYLPYSSYVIKESIKRNTTIYLSDNHIPMLPPELIDKATLKEGKEKFANSYYFEISNNGEIVSQRFEKTIIKNNSQLTYDAANKIIAGDNCDDFALKETLLNLAIVSNIISTKYKESVLYNIIKSQKQNVSLNIVGNSIAEKIVSNVMILTNNMVAEFFYNNAYPFIYRIHEVKEAQQEEIMNFVSNLMNDFSSNDFDRIYDILKSNYPTASYALTGEHEGLKVKHYTHITSPIRRAADLVASECLNRCYYESPTSNELKNLRAELIKIIPEINESEERINMFAWDYEKNKGSLKRLKKSLHL